MARPLAALLLFTFAGVCLASCTEAEQHSQRAPVLETTKQALSAASLFGTSLPPKTLALTFDDGPGARAGELSAYLRAQGIRAAFFANGARIASSTLPNPNGITPTANAATILASIVADGHLVANHGVTHRDLVTTVLTTGATFLTRELAETDVDIAAYVPSNHFLFRAPYGSYNQAVYDALRVGAMNKYVGPVNWEMGGVSNNYPSQAADWACWQDRLQSGGGGAQFGVTTQQCGDAYLTEIAAVGRGIVLMHDPYSSTIGNTVDMVKYIVPILKANGYAFVRVDEVPAIAALLPPPACDASCATCTGGGACASCRPGSYLIAGTCQPCVMCGAGSYVASACTTTANTVCGTCAPSCATCSGAGANRCTSCADGAYLGGGSCRACGTCAAGQYEAAACTAVTDAVCPACSAGTFSNAAGSLACSECAPGTFASAAGATSCAACAPGTFAAARGQTACSPCDPGLFSSGGGAAACSSCAAGTFAGPGAATCSACPAGTSSPDGAAACTACAAGSHALEGAPACSPCEPGTFAATAGAAVCTSCATCDDGDACTTDTCSETLGCGHVRLPACPPDAGVPDAAPLDGGARDTGVIDAPPASIPQATDAAADAGRDAEPAVVEPSSDSGCALGRSTNDRVGLIPVALGMLALACARRRRAATGTREDRAHAGT